MTNFNEFEQHAAAPANRESGTIISHAFDNYKKVILYGIIMFVLVTVISSIFSSVFQNLTGYDNQEMNDQMQDMIRHRSFDMSVFTHTPGFGTNIGISYLVGLLLYPLYAGFLYIINKANFGQDINFSDLFIGYKQNTLQIILYGLISGIIMSIGFALCFLPGIFVAPLFFLGLPIVFFENTTALDAVKKSFELTKENYWPIFGTAILSFLIAIAGILLCGIGVLISFPFLFAAIYSTYCAYCGAPRQLEYNQK